MSASAIPSENDFMPAPARAIAPYFILGLIIFAAYINVFGNGFLFDDELLIQENTYLLSWGHIGDIILGSTTSGTHVDGGFYRPLQMLLYLPIFQLGGGDTFWFHFLNLALHIANSFFVYRLGVKLGFNPWGVFGAALIWGLHPLHTEAVTYMSATADPLFVFFILWTMVLLLPDITPRKIMRVIPLFLLALLSKETAVIFPLLVMTCLFLKNPERLNLRAYLCTWPLWGISILYTLWRLHAKGFNGPQDADAFNAMHNYDNWALYGVAPLYRIETFLATLPAYLKLLVWPEGLHMERSFPMYTTIWDLPVMMGLGLIVAAAMQIALSSKKADSCLAMSWGLLWFFAAHLPDSGIFVPVNAVFLEHWMYLSSIGLFLGLGETAALVLEKRLRASSFSFFAALTVAGIFFVRTHEQNLIWHDPVSFYGNIFKYGERSERAHNNLGLYYMNQGDYDDAIDQFKQALAISDTYARTWYNLAVTYLHMPNQSAHIQDAIESLNKSLAVDPKFYRSYKLLGDIYEFLGDQDKAKNYHDKASTLLLEQQ